MPLDLWMKSRSISSIHLITSVCHPMRDSGSIPETVDLLQLHDILDPCVHGICSWTASVFVVKQTKHIIGKRRLERNTELVHQPRDFTDEVHLISVEEYFSHLSLHDQCFACRREDSIQ